MDEATKVLIVSNRLLPSIRKTLTIPLIKCMQSGAGPSGLVLALSLLQNGIPVRIIDKEFGPRLGERGAGVSVRSCSLLIVSTSAKNTFD